MQLTCLTPTLMSVIAYLARHWHARTLERLTQGYDGSLPQQACRRQVLVDVSNYLARTGYAKDR